MFSCGCSLLTLKLSMANAMLFLILASDSKFQQIHSMMCPPLRSCRRIRYGPFHNHAGCFISGLETDIRPQHAAFHLPVVKHHRVHKIVLRSCSCLETQTLCLNAVAGKIRNFPYSVKCRTCWLCTWAQIINAAFICAIYQPYMKGFEDRYRPIHLVVRSGPNYISA
jgi:hypothetical protein